jgi:hypothetical protein
VKGRDELMKTLRAMLAGAVGAMVLTGCEPMESRRATPDQMAWLARINQEPLEFEIPKADAADAWERGRSFFSLYSTMKIQLDTDYALQTYNAKLGSRRSRERRKVYYGYSVTKFLLKDTVRLAVSCNTKSFSFGEGENTQNAHILAHYLRTGELPYPDLISR